MINVSRAYTCPTPIHGIICGNILDVSFSTWHLLIIFIEVHYVLRRMFPGTIFGLLNVDLILALLYLWRIQNRHKNSF